jgi:signal transduction histidine kinase
MQGCRRVCPCGNLATTRLTTAQSTSFSNGLAGTHPRPRLSIVRDRVAVERRRVVVCGEVDKASVVIAVEDSGLGFGTLDPSRLFDTFSTTKATGLGMGLSISRSIVERHGGRLWAESNLRHGATFRFALPAVA